MRFWFRRTVLLQRSEFLWQDKTIYAITVKHTTGFDTTIGELQKD